jgi:hypothetical protein
VEVGYENPIKEKLTKKNITTDKNNVKNIHNEKM